MTDARKYGDAYFSGYNYPKPSELKVLKSSTNSQVAEAAVKLLDASMCGLAETERKPYLVAITSALQELRS